MKTPLLLRIVLLHSLLLPSSAFSGEPSQIREWTNKEGASFSGKLLDVDKAAKTAKIERADGRVFEIDYTRLVGSDIALLESFTSPPKGLSLRGGWERGIDKAAKAAEDLDHVLSLGQVSPGVDLSPDDSIHIYREFTYLQKLGDARKILSEVYGTPEATANGVVGTSGFPGSTIHFHDFDIPLDGFTRLTLVTDAADQLVAVQLLNNTPKSLLLSGHSSQWSLFNFINNRRKGSSAYRIAYEVDTVDKVLQIDSELIDKDLKPREWTRLYMPVKFAAVVRHVIGL
ncbi:MAG TPA: hypothetical protein PLA50_03795 [Bacteroidia bacterium]|nr:hypothetical protein [Bacteroidia bacterium]